MTSSAMKTPPTASAKPTIKLASSVWIPKPNKIIRAVPLMTASTIITVTKNPIILFMRVPPKRLITLIIPL